MSRFPWLLLSTIIILGLINETTCEILDIYTSSLDNTTREYVRRNLGETDEIRDRSIQEIRRWIKSNKSKFNAKLDYLWILTFLRANKYDLNRTKKKIVKYLTLRAQSPEWYVGRDPLKPKVNDVLKLGTYLPLIKRDPKGRVVIIQRPGAYDTDLFDFTDIMLVGNMLLDLVLNEVEEFAIYGMVIVLDMTGYSFSHIVQVPPSVLQKLAALWQDSSFQVDEIDFFNAPTYFNIALSLFKQFLSREFSDKIHWYTGTNMTEVLPKDILPVEYGGTSGTLQELIDHWVERSVSMREWFLEDEKYTAFL